jgi:hypothetical protein
MLTYRQIVSDIVDDVKAINLDDRLSYRFIKSKFSSELSYFLRLEAKSREFAKLQNLWKPINCVRLQEVDPQICAFADVCATLSRSVDKIPEAFGTNYGLLLKVLTADGKQTIPLVANSSEYKDFVTRRWGGDKIACYLEDGYLFIPNTLVDSVKILLVPVDPFKVDKANGAVGCKFALDREVPYPEYLVTLAKRQVLQELLGGTKRVVEDEKGNDNTNIKS